MTSFIDRLIKRADYKISYSKPLENYIVTHRALGIVYVGEKHKCENYAKATFA